MSISSTLVCPENKMLPGEPPEQPWDDWRDADVLTDDRLVEIFEAGDKGDVGSRAFCVQVCIAVSIWLVCILFMLLYSAHCFGQITI